MVKKDTYFIDIYVRINAYMRHDPFLYLIKILEAQINKKIVSGPGSKVFLPQGYEN